MALRLTLRSCFHVALLLGAVALWGFPAGAATWYVSATKKGDAEPGTNWASAKETIQGAISVATNGDVVLVTNGIYSVTSMNPTFAAGMSNRVMIDKAIRVQSVNGPGVTSIRGAQDPSGTNGEAAIRCAYVGPGATLSGFTLTNGATRRVDLGGGNTEKAGGGVFAAGLVENCIITGNAGIVAGGAFGDDGGGFTHCIFSNNIAFNYVSAGDFWNGAGAVYQLSSTVDNSLMVSNRGNFAGAVAGGWVVNCTVVRNVSTNTALYLCDVVNSIVFYNSGNNLAGNRQIDTNSTVAYTCSRPLVTGTGNITNAPLFVSTNNLDFHLGPFSPCVDVLDGLITSTDLDGLSRIYHGRMDMGCYERQLAGDINNDGLVNAADLNTLITNYTGGLDQTAVSLVLSNYWPNAQLLAMTNVAGLGGSNVTFALSNSSAGAYNVQYSTNLTNWAPLGAALPRYLFTDPDGGTSPQRYYRLSVP
jgi:hypothetical protein